jgi:hypothetical protein
MKVMKPEPQSDDETKLMSSVNNPFVDMKQEEISEPFSFVTVKVRSGECCHIWESMLKTCVKTSVNFIMVFQTHFRMF